LETLLWTPEEGYFLLERHLDRLRESAEYFDFQCDIDKIRKQLHENQSEAWDDARKVRFTLNTDGTFEIENLPLPENSSANPVILQLASSPVNPENVFLYHKTTNRRVYEQAVKEAEAGDDVILYNTRHEITESCIANVVLELDGALYTPPVRCGLLGGTFRDKLLSDGIIKERTIKKLEIEQAANIYLVNSVRKWRRAMLKNHDHAQ